MVLFRTEERFVPLLQRKTKSYLVRDVERFIPQLLREIIDLDKGLARWDPREDAFVARLQEFHRRLVAQLETTLDRKLDEDKTFLQALEKWIKDQGWEYNKESQRNFIQQASYLLLNKLIFYKVLRNEPAYSESVPSINLKVADISDQLKSTFAGVIKNIDFQAVFEQDPVFDEVPLNETVNDEVKGLLHELDEFDLSKFGSDVIGRIYQNILPPKERHDLGQYYTPPEVCELITLLTVKDPYAHVLDPAVGSGGFVVKAYERLKTLRKKAGIADKHTEIMNQIHAVDINRFPAHLTAINLALRDLSSRTENVDVEVSNFFNVIPQQKRMAIERALAKGKKIIHMAAPSKVDAIIGNPPYIRQEKIEGKGNVRAHLQKLHYTGMSDRSDIYCYFFTHSSEFLKESGYLSFITSNRWLTVGYGKSLQTFLLSNFKIRAIIAFDRQVFKEPLIGTVITVLQKCNNENERNENIVRFLRFKQSINLEKIAEKAETEYQRDLFYEDGELRLVTKQQKTLYDEDKWHRYLYAPTFYFELLSSKKMAPLVEVAKVARGITTNANEFFYFRGVESSKDWGIPESLISPLIKHVRQTEFIEVSKKDTDWFVLDLHQVVKEILSSERELSSGSEAIGIVKQELRKRGLNDLLQYIKHGEERGINNKTALRSRKVWFDLGDLPRPPIMFPEVYWKKAQVLHNKDGMTLDKRLYSIWPNTNIDVEVLLGILNSDLLLLMREIDGRVEEGQAMNRNSVMVFEAKNLRILDPRKLSSDESNRIRHAFAELIEQERKLNKESLKPLCIELNRAVLAVLFHILGFLDKATDCFNCGPVSGTVSIRVSFPRESMSASLHL